MKVIYEDIFSVSNIYKSYRVSFWGMSPVRAKFRCRVGVGQ